MSTTLGTPPLPFLWQADSILQLSLLCFSVQGLPWTEEDPTLLVQEGRLECQAENAPQRSPQAIEDASQFKTTPASSPGGRTRLTKLYSTLSPTGPHLLASVSHSSNLLSKEPYAGTLPYVSPCTSNAFCHHIPNRPQYLPSNAGLMVVFCLRHLCLRHLLPNSA